ncbi:unnamed protein product [Scytosiphon promiscuus]
MHDRPRYRLPFLPPYLHLPPSLSHTRPNYWCSFPNLLLASALFFSIFLNQKCSPPHKLSTHQPYQQTRAEDQQPRAATGSFGGFSALLGSNSVPRWTPPLSPSSAKCRFLSAGGEKENRGGEKENRQLISPHEAINVLRTPGLPPLALLAAVQTSAGVASRAWLRDFLIRGGRRYVNAKVNEIAQLEMEAKKRLRKRALMPKIFGRRGSNEFGYGGGVEGNSMSGLPSRMTLRDIAEAREEVMKLVLFLHLRE